MTVRKRYELLEAAGWYAEAEADPPREVLVTFGDATLTILRFDETPIAHWPLGSLSVCDAPGAAGRGARTAPALTLAPYSGAAERLVLDDRDMIEAIRALRPDLGAPAPRAPLLGRRGRRVVIAAAVVLALGAAWWSAPALVDKVALLTPPQQRAALGEAAIEMAFGPSLCRAPDGRRALDRYAAQLSAAAGAPVRLAATRRPGPDGVDALPAPGGWVLLFPVALESPEALALAAARATAWARAHSPTGAALREAGGAGLVGALAGRLDADRLTDAAARRLTAPPAELTAAAPQLTEAAAALAAQAGAPDPLGAEWRTLQTICD
jgi:hypothetical protein